MSSRGANQLQLLRETGSPEAFMIEPGKGIFFAV
jgi:hypothetical protein